MPEYLITTTIEYRTKVRNSDPTSALESAKERDLSKWEEISRTETADLIEDY